MIIDKLKVDEIFLCSYNNCKDQATYYIEEDFYCDKHKIWIISIIKREKNQMKGII